MSCNMYVTGSGKPFSPSKNTNSSQRIGNGISSNRQGNTDQGKDRISNDTTRSNIKFNKERVDEITTELRARGYSDEQISGVLGAWYNESKFNTSIKGDNGTSFGLGQWHNERWTALNNYANQNNLDPSSVKAQVGFFDYEMKSSERKAGQMLSNSNSISEASSAMYRYERFYGWNNDAGSSQRDSRLQNANTFYDYLKESGNPSRQ